MQSETGFPSRPSHQLKSYVASKSRLKLAARAVVSADAGLIVRSTVASRRDKLTVSTHVAAAVAAVVTHRRFLANVNSRSRSLYAIARPSVVCLSSVCLSVCLSVTFVRPTQAA